MLTAAAAAAGLLLAGCGFRLRAPPRLPFASAALTGFSARSPMAAELRRQMAPQVRLLDTPDKAEVVLQALDDARERVVVAQTAAAQVREVQLRVRFSVRVYTSSGRELLPRVELLLARDMSYSETQALAKEQEEAELFREMQADAVAQLLRRLAAISP